MVNAKPDDTVEGAAYFTNDGDQEAFDELPERWRRRLSLCPVLFSAKSTLYMINKFPENYVLERYIETVYQMTGVQLTDEGLPPMS